MALVLNYTATSSDLPAFLDGWVDGFAYRGNGFFNSVLDASDQWVAGTPIAGGVPNGQSSVIVSGNDFSYTPGVVDGAVDTLALGANLRYVAAGDQWVQEEGLSISFSGARLTPAFAAAISDLSQNGSLTGLYAYFAEQGTEQHATAGNDVLQSFGGTDVLFGDDGADRFVFAGAIGQDTVADFDPCEGDVIDLSGISWISSYADLLIHSNLASGLGNDLVLSNGTETITFTDYAAGRVIVDGLTGGFEFA